MDLSPRDRAQLIERAAELLVESIRQEVGDLTELMVLPLSTAATLVGVSPRSLSRMLPVVHTVAGKHGVQVSAIRQHLAAKTNNPANTQ